MKKILLLMASFSVQANAEFTATKFNALSPADPHYAEYQRNLCQWHREVVADLRKNRDEVSVIVSDQFAKEYRENCQ